MKIRGYSLNGILFWTSEHLPLQENAGDFLTLGFNNGKLLFQYNLGSGRGVISYNRTLLSDGKWHTIKVHRYEIKIVFHHLKVKRKGFRIYNCFIILI